MAHRLALRRPALSLWHPATWLATWFGAGLLPLAPGSWGSLAALPFAWLILSAGGPAFLLVAAALVFLAGWWATARYMVHAGRKDPSEIVIDEVSGQWLSLLVADTHVWWHWVAGFLFFRLCDIAKPYPAYILDRRGGAFAVMADDAVAAVYALFLLAVTIFARRIIHGS